MKTTRPQPTLHSRSGIDESRMSLGSMPQRFNRRRFLTASATALAGLATMDVARFAHASGRDILRVGLIGCGGRNTGAGAQALRADRGARLVAMADLFLERIRHARQVLRDELAREGRADQVQVPDEHCFTGFDAFRRVIELSDVVLIANAAKFHPWHMLAAVEAGRHVFVEKPHAIDPYGLRMLERAVALGRQKGVCMVSGLQSRYHTGYQETIRKIRDGAIGQIVAIEENFLRGPYGLLERPPGLLELQWQCYAQYRFRWLSGDDVVQSLVHNLDRVSWVLGEAAPIKCHGMGGRSTLVEARYGDVFDHHALVYDMPNGVKVYAFCRTTPGCYDENSSLIYGTEGRADLLGCRIFGKRPWRWQGQCDPYQEEHNALFAAIRAGQTIDNGDYMIRSTQIAVMGQCSCYTGREITWEQVQRSQFGYPPKPEDCRDDMKPPTQPGPDGTYPAPRPGQTRFEDL
ncbi:MAG: Gfo/Idh/MocA family oxidoreductase [Verrucomicrobiota bacterium]|nr:Gfo/Idh/MocA family oxidoreductase [Verrucomicrobiota bacterium]